MDEQRSWQERWGVGEVGLEHVLVLASLALLVLAPFLALARGDAGFIALASALFLFLFAAMMSGASDDKSKPDDQK